MYSCWRYRVSDVFVLVQQRSETPLNVVNRISGGGRA